MTREMGASSATALRARTLSPPPLRTVCRDLGVAFDVRCIHAHAHVRTYSVLRPIPSAAGCSEPQGRLLGGCPFW
jgi:hypothetical protein